mgnify:FL=1
MQGKEILQRLNKVSQLIKENKVEEGLQQLEYIKDDIYMYKHNSL